MVLDPKLDLPSPQFHRDFSKVASLEFMPPVGTPELSMENVVISSDHDSFPVSLKPLLECAKLEALRVNVSLGSLTDHVDVITQLRQLTSLDDVVGSYSEIECLLHFCPWLVSLDLGGLTTVSAENLQQWFDKKCDREVDFSYICGEGEEDKEEKEMYE
ncbi:hypothetical protein BGZ46_005079, partial [Entomortierella lignicola]